VTKTSSTGLAGLFPSEGTTTTYTRPAMRRDDGASRFTGTVSRFLPATNTATITRLDRKLQYALDIPKAEYTECPLGGCPVPTEKPQPQPTEQKQPTPTHDPGCTMKIASNTLDIKPSLQKRTINGFGTDEYVIDWRLIFEDPSKRQSLFELNVDTWNTAPPAAMRDAMALELAYARNAAIAVSRDAGTFALPPQFVTLMTGYLASGLAAADRASLTNLVRQFEKVKGTPILMQLQVNFKGDACGGTASDAGGGSSDAGSPVKSITSALSGMFGKGAGDATPAAEPPLLSFTYEVQKYGIEGVHDAVFDPPPNFRRTNPR
jgi:hypothetical protein